MKAGGKLEPWSVSALRLLISKWLLTLNSFGRTQNSEAEPACYLCKGYCGKLLCGPPPTGKMSNLNQHRNEQMYVFMLSSNV